MLVYDQQLVASCLRQKASFLEQLGSLGFLFVGVPFLPSLSVVFVAVSRHSE